MCGVDPVDDLVGGEPDQPELANDGFDDPGPIEPLARCVDDLDEVAARTSGGGEVGESDGRYGAVTDNAGRQNHRGRSDERGSNGDPARSDRQRHLPHGQEPLRRYAIVRWTIIEPVRIKLIREISSP